jgi:hypothetical protein
MRQLIKEINAGISTGIICRIVLIRGIINEK